MRLHDSMARIAIVAVLVAAGLGASSVGWSALTKWQQRRLDAKLAQRIAAADEIAADAPPTQIVPRDNPPTSSSATRVIPPAPIALPDRSTKPSEERRPAPAASRQKPAPTPKSARPYKPDWTPQWQNEKLARPLPKLTTPSSIVIADTPRRAASSEVIDVPSPTDLARLATSLRDAPTDELLQQIPNANFYRAGIIRAVLRQRGLADTELELADRLLSDDVDDRLQLLNDLSVLPAGAARRWLRLLLRDKSADVRLRALTAMATTSDPQLYDLAREMALNDDDTRVAELASSIMRRIQ